ncbi:MAG TPA: hypothetical protein VKI62_03630, partial [Bacteroidota bacterium]|nr:hypothetical protein [Bacteroidota bacterium]
MLHSDSSLLVLHRQVRTAKSARSGLIACPLHFVGANRRAAVRAIARQQVGAMDRAYRRGGSHRYGRGHRVNGWRRRRGILIPGLHAAPEESLQ